VERELNLARAGVANIDELWRADQAAGAVNTAKDENRTVRKDRRAMPGPSLIQTMPKYFDGTTFRIPNQHPRLRGGSTFSARNENTAVGEQRD